MTNPHEKQTIRPEIQLPPSVFTVLSQAEDGGVKLVLPTPEVNGQVLPYNPRLVSVHTDQENDHSLMVDSYAVMDFADLHDQPELAINTRRAFKELMAWCPYDKAVLDEYGKKIGIKLEHVPEIRDEIKKTNAVSEKSVSKGSNHVWELPNGADKPLRLTKNWKGSLVQLFDAVLTPPEEDKASTISSQDGK